jgi:hypothetical protein
MTPEQYERAGEILKKIKNVKYSIDLVKRPKYDVCASTRDGIILEIPEDVRKSVEMLTIHGLENYLAELEKEFNEL